MSSTNDALPLPQIARALLHRVASGVLSTASAAHEGWPFGSLAPFALTPSGDAVLVLSDLAEHTKNVRTDPRASLFVTDAEPSASSGAAQASARIALLGRVSEPAGDALADARARYIARHPEADGYLTKLDFRVYVLAIEHVRLIGGFGRIAWLPASAVREVPESDPLLAHANDILAHMNDDHADVLALYVRAFRDRPAVERATMVGVDSWGFDVRDAANDELFRFDFTARCSEPDAVRREVVTLAKNARAKLAG